MSTTLGKIVLAGIISLGGLGATQLIQSTQTTGTNKIEVTQSQTITLEEAKNIALKKVNGTITKTKEDHDDYTIYIQKDNYLYEVEVNKITGNIDEIDKEVIKSTTQKITLEQAKQIALKKVKGTVTKTTEDHDDYTIYIQKDNYLYEVEVNKITGNIDEIDKEVIKSTNQKITLEKAKQIALKKVSGTITKTKEDHDEYTIYIKKGNYLYEVEIDKYTGEIEDIDKEVIKSTTQKITLEKAKQIALKKVSGTITKTKEDHDEYTIFIKKGNYLYEVEVDKYTGEIEDIDKEIIKSTNKKITLEKAKQIALKKVNGTVTKTKEDHDEYTIYIKKGNYLYEVEVDKYTGEIEDIDKEVIKSTKTITAAKAKEIALKRVNGKVVSVDYDNDDNEYEVEIIKDNVKYEIKIDGTSGKILKVDVDD